MRLGLVGRGAGEVVWCVGVVVRDLVGLFFLVFSIVYIFWVVFVR